MLSLFFVGIGLPVVLMTTLLLYRTMYIPKPVDMLVVRLSVSFVAQLAIFNIIGLLQHATSIDMNASTYNILALFVAGVIYLIQRLRGLSPMALKLTRFDVVAVIPVFIGLMIFLVYLFGNNLSPSENLIRFMGSSSDQSAHLSMYSDILRNNGNHVYATDRLSINTPGISSYPMGWHQSMAVLTLSVIHINNTAPFIDTVIAYFFCAILTFVLFGVALSIITGLLYRRTFIDSLSLRALNQVHQHKAQEIAVWVFSVLLAMFLFLYVTFSELGYVNFIFATALMLLGAIIMLGIADQKQVTAGTIVIFILLTFVAAEAWYIMAVPIGLALMCLTWMYMRHRRKIELPRDALTGIGLIGGYALLGYAFLVILNNVIADSSIEQIQIGGAAAPWLPDGLVLLGAIIGAVIIVNRTKTSLFYIVVNCLFVSVLLLTALNFINLQTYSYYQQKMLYAFFSLCIPIVVMVLIRMLGRWKVGLYVSMSLIIFFIYMINPSNIIYITKNIMRPTSDPEITIITKYFQSEFNNKSDMTFIKDYRTNDERSTESYARLFMSRVVSPGDCYNKTILPLLSLSGLSERPKALIGGEINRTVYDCYGGARFYVLTDSLPVGVEHIK